MEDRQLLINRWNTEFAHRPTPDYYQSFGLGFFEYFQLCEDIGASPLPLVNCGMACEFNSNELCPLDQLGPYLQDALDLIEFANGPTNSTWGAKRAAMGHPEPFNLKMLGVGNEQWGQQYIDRYILFANAIKAKYPEIQLVSAAGPDPAMTVSNSPGRSCANCMPTSLTNIATRIRAGFSRTRIATTITTATGRKYFSANTPRKAIKPSV